MLNSQCCHLTIHNGRKVCAKYANETIKACPLNCAFYKSAQLSLFDDENKAKLDEWIELNPVPYEAICSEFCRQGLLDTKRISVRDIWSWARTNFTGVKRGDGSQYAFDNRLTSSLSMHLCAKFPSFADKVEHRGEWKIA